MRARIIAFLRALPLWCRMMLRRAGPDRQASMAVTSLALCQHPVLRALAGGRVQFHSRLWPATAPLIIGWGQKLSGQRALAMPMRRAALVEDGFLRSFARHDPPASAVLDDLGIYYDARHPSCLDRLTERPLQPAEITRARAIAQLWRDGQVSKYNDQPDPMAELPAAYILVVDQVADDLSIRGGGASPDDFAAMLHAALRDHPDLPVLLKQHPDCANGQRRGHFDSGSLPARVTRVTAACHPVALIRGARAVYTVTSQLGFEALIHQVPVHCFGMPFYAGRGLTRDSQRPPEFRRPCSLEQLIHAAMVEYITAIDPDTGKICDIETLIDRIAARRARALPIHPVVHGWRLSRRKRQFLAAYLPGSRIIPCRNARKIPPGATVALWGAAMARDLPAARLLRIEDGFIRSRGLGAALTPPLSWVIDDCGMHYDPHRPSRLDLLLRNGPVDPALRARAAALVADIRRLGITKYNLGGQHWRRPATAGKVVLVAGQVETDAALRAIRQGPRRNIDLLRLVRQAQPDAYIIYKPHPDVTAALRPAGPGAAQMRHYCDEILAQGDAADLLDQVDEVHVMTSLFGFEALLRGCPVICHGQPFYAGWGLTTDLAPLPQRPKDRIDLIDLAAVALILYPRYLDPATGQLTTPEEVVARLARPAPATPRQTLTNQARMKAMQWRALLGFAP
jgi:capsular polysaccharide export protein